MSFVELDRTFDKWTEDRPPADSSLLAGFGGSTHWPQLVELQRVVVLAEAGSGKSGELMNQAAVQQKCGRFGFYATVQDIARDGLQAALRIEDLPKFSEWKASVMPAWFFVDSIDEAKLDGIRLETALRRISEGIQGLTGRANIILSARITDWEFRADLARFNDIWPIPVAASPSPPEAPREALVLVLNHERRRDSVDGPNKPSVFLMAPLDSPRVRTFFRLEGSGTSR